MERGGSGTSNGKDQFHQINRVALSIKSQDGEKNYYRMARDKKMYGLFSDYCKQRNMDYRTVMFYCDGRHIKSTSTPNELGLEDGDQIDAFVHQHGGGGYSVKKINPKSI